MTEQVFCEIAYTYRRLLYHVAYTLLRDNQACEDAIQEALFKAWQKRTSLREEGAFKYWLVRILSNTCNDMLRKQRRAAVLATQAADRADVSADSEEHILRNRALHDALATLPAELRLPTVLYYLEGFPIAEIARLERSPQGTIRNRLFRARQQLKTFLEKEMPI